MADVVYCTDEKAPPGANRFNAWFDHKAADVAVTFFRRFLRHTEAEWFNEPFVLADWQANRIIRPAFGWKRGDGTRLFRVVYIEVPRKNGKTEMAAGIALLLQIGDGEFGGQVYCGAVDENQAKIVFNKATTMVGLSPELSKIYTPYKTSLWVQELLAGFEPMSSTAATKHGFSPSGFIGDEIHEWKNGDLHDVVHKGTIARRQPLEVLLTTAGIRGHGYGWEMHERAEKVLTGVIEDPTFLPVIFAADPEDDWTDPEVWAKANPNFGVSVKSEFIETECSNAQESPRKENEFRRFHLNQWVEQSVRWLPIHRWDRCTGPVDWRDLPDHLSGRECFGGVDLSTKRDLTSIGYVFPPVSDDPLWYVVSRYFLPSENMADRVKNDRVPYDVWADQGAITLTDGSSIDYDFIAEQLHDDARRFYIREVPFDPWNATMFAQRMQTEGATMVEFRQGAKSYSEPCKDFETLVFGALLAHGGNPVTRWNAANIAIRIDPNDNWAPDKAKSSERIDGIVAILMGYARARVFAAPPVQTIGSDYQIQLG